MVPHSVTCIVSSYCNELKEYQKSSIISCCQRGKQPLQNKCFRNYVCISLKLYLVLLLFLHFHCSSVLGFDGKKNWVNSGVMCVCIDSMSAVGLRCIDQPSVSGGREPKQADPKPIINDKRVLCIRVM